MILLGLRQYAIISSVRLYGTHSNCDPLGSRLWNWCKQHQEQQSAAWAWHHEGRNFVGAALFFSSPLERPFASLVINTQ